MIARKPEPHAWLTVYPGTSCGSPLRMAICRAEFGPTPACRALPKITSSTALGSMPLRASVAFALATPRSGAVIDASAPPNLPIGVRTAAMRKMSFISCLLPVARCQCGQLASGNRQLSQQLHNRIAVHVDCSNQLFLGDFFVRPVRVEDRAGPEQQWLAKRAEVRDVAVERHHRERRAVRDDHELRPVPARECDLAAVLDEKKSELLAHQLDVGDGAKDHLALRPARNHVRLLAAAHD